MAPRLVSELVSEGALRRIHVTIVTISGPKVRAQNGRQHGKWPKKLVEFWDRHVFVIDFRHAGQKVSASPATFSVKTQILLVNGSEDARTDAPPDLT